MNRWRSRGQPRRPLAVRRSTAMPSASPPTVDFPGRSRRQTRSLPPPPTPSPGSPAAAATRSRWPPSTASAPAPGQRQAGRWFRNSIPVLLLVSSRWLAMPVRPSRGSRQPTVAAPSPGTALRPRSVQRRSFSTKTPAQRPQPTRPPDSSMAPPIASKSQRSMGLARAPSPRCQTPSFPRPRRRSLPCRCSTNS